MTRTALLTGDVNSFPFTCRIARLIGGVAAEYGGTSVEVVDGRDVFYLARRNGVASLSGETEPGRLSGVFSTEDDLEECCRRACAVLDREASLRVDKGLLVSQEVST